MTTLFGSPHEAWPLSRAVDALVASARRAGFPGLFWAAGLVYPSLGLGLGILQVMSDVLRATTDVDLDLLGRLGAEGESARPLFGPAMLLALDDASETARQLLYFVALLPLTLAIARLIAGLASLSEDEAWNLARGGGRAPSLLATWRAGRGLSLSAFGLILTYPLLLFGAVLFLLGPVVVLLNLFALPPSLGSLVAVVLMPLVLILMSYGVLLQVLVQLGLHSLARNRRGFASALTHAWRLVRNSPWSAVRAALVDLALLALLLGFTGLAESILQTPGTVLAWLVWAFAGVLRAGYWCRTYDGLGGLTTIDGSQRLVGADSAATS